MVQYFFFCYEEPLFFGKWMERKAIKAKRAVEPFLRFERWIQSQGYIPYDR